MNMRDIDLNLLLVFEAIYSTGSISRAAERLDLSQPAASNALSRLRQQLGDRLFLRSGNGVVPTARAEEIIGPVRNALDSIRSSLGPADAFDPDTTERHFKLIIADPLERIVIAGIANGLKNDSKLSFELLPPQNVQIEDALLNFSIDLAAFLLPARHGELISQPLCPVDMVMVARKGHPRIKGKMTLEVLKSERFVGLSLAPGKLKNSEKLTVWQRLGRHPSVQVHKASSIAQIAAKTDMIGLVSSIYADEFAETYGLQVFETPMPMSNQQFHMIWHKRFDDDPAHRWLRRQVTDALVAKSSF